MAGPLASALVLAAACATAPRSVVGDAVCAGAALAALGALLSDMPCGPLLGLRPPPGCFCCGNWGCLIPKEAMRKPGAAPPTQLLPDACVQLLTRILDLVELRGAQA